MKIKNWLYYLLFAFIGYFIYKFQIEKSFNLLTIYTLAIAFSFFSFVTKTDSRKTLPFLFVCSLFMMYGVSNEDSKYHLQIDQFAIILLLFALIIFIALSSLKLLVKKLAVLIIGILAGIIYVIPGESMSGYKYIPFLVGSFFMFRIICFLHDIKFMKNKAPLLDNINYFLLTPNFSMPLFPIVDYKSFISSYQGITPQTLKRSSLLICKGVFQMLLYRFIYHEIIIPFDEIHTASQVLVFLVANFMIVLRVIGAFHIAIGLVVLSGYNIPDIFNNIFFSTGFSNLWRRTNMYWRNFMIKIFYYPIYFRIKKIGIYPALFVATFVCFFITWFLHTYQWYWLKGSFPVELKDLIFWGSFGLLVSTNTLIQQRQLDKKHTPKEHPYEHFVQAGKGLVVLLIMSVLWSIWTSNTLSNWWMLLSKIKNINLHDLKIIGLFGIGYLTIASAYHYYEKYKSSRFVLLNRNMDNLGYIGFVTLMISMFTAGILLLQNNSMFYRLRLVPLISEQLNKADLIVIDNGYYTNLISTNNYCSQVWVNDFDISRNWTKYITAKTTKPSFDLMLTENIPFASVNYKGINFTLNSEGLRDKEYSKVKPDSTYRIIVLGGSYECGNGITDGQDFLSVVEDKLNTEYSITQNGSPVNIEIINFSSNGYRLVQRLYQYKDNARAWDPDVLFLFIHTNYRMRIVNYVNRLVYQGFDINDAYVKNIITQAGIEKSDDGPAVRDKLGMYADSINYYCVKRISEIAHEDSTEIFAVYLPAIKDKSRPRDSLFMANLCNWYDIQPIRLNGVFSGFKPEELSLSDLDFHPNKKASDLIVNKLLTQIIANKQKFKLEITKK